jgi:hypothetical protein
MNRAATQNRRLANPYRVPTSIVCFAILSACGGPVAAPEEQLRQWVSRVEEAAEAKERRELISMISPDYTDSRDNERPDIENMLRAYFFRQNSISLLTNIEDVRLIADSAAEIELTVGMAGQNDGVFGFSADAYRFEMELMKEGDDWLLISARWGELGDELH